MLRHGARRPDEDHRQWGGGHDNTTISVDANGTYSWLVEYGGDATHSSATSTCSTEHFAITFTNGS